MAAAPPVGRGADLGHPVPLRVAGGAPPRGEPKNQPPFTTTAKTTKTTTGKTGTKPPPAFDPSNPATWGVGMGPDQTSAIVKQQIQDAIDPQVAGLQTQQKTYDTEQAANQASLTAYYKALADALGGESGAVSNAYNGAASTIGQVGQGLTGDAQTAMNAQDAQTQAILARGGQTQAADYGAAHANPGGAALNPFYSEHVLSPAEGLAGTGAARATEAAAQPRIWASTGRDVLTAAIQKAVDGDSQFQQKIADIYSQVPGLRDRILTQVQSFETQQRQLKDTETELGIKNQATEAGIQAKINSSRLQQQKLTADIAHWNAQLQNSALDRASRLQIAAQSRAAQRQLVQLRAEEQKNVALWKKQNGIGGSGSTSDSWPKVSAAIQKQIQYLWQHPQTAAQKNPYGKITVPAGHQKPQDVINTMFSSFVSPYLKTVPANQQATVRKQAMVVIKNAMRAAGWKV